MVDTVEVDMPLSKGLTLLQDKLQWEGRKEQPSTEVVHKEEEEEHIELLDCTLEHWLHSSLDIQPLKVSVLCLRLCSA